MRIHGSVAAFAALALTTVACGSSASQTDGGTAACQQISALDRSCTTTTDCIAVLHTTSCCGSQAWLGLRATEGQRFTMLEPACDATYPACGCAAGPPTTDD